MIGSLAGSYKVISFLAKGGMGEVFVAEHQVIGRRAAVKFLLPALSADRVIVKRFFNEARAAAQIDHPGIVDVFDVGFVNGRAFIVMELLQGETLSDRISRRRPTIPEAIHVTRQISGVLEVAHRHGIVHRDLKPDNIFLVPDPDVVGGERIKVVDFGIAKLVNSKSAIGTQTGSVFGTPAYMAPEQCKSTAKADHRADIYSIGCILYELLTGSPPFGKGGMEVVSSHLRDEPLELRHFLPSAPPQLERIASRLLAKRREERFQSCAELGEALGGLLEPAPTDVPAADRATVMESAIVAGPRGTIPLAGDEGNIVSATHPHPHPHPHPHAPPAPRDTLEDMAPCMEGARETPPTIPLDRGLSPTRLESHDTGSRARCNDHDGQPGVDTSNAPSEPSPGPIEVIKGPDITRGASVCGRHMAIPLVEARATNTLTADHRENRSRVAAGEFSTPPTLPLAQRSQASSSPVPQRDSTPQPPSDEDFRASSRPLRRSLLTAIVVGSVALVAVLVTIALVSRNDTRAAGAPLPATMAASSEFRPWKGDTFTASNLVDGDLATCWQAQHSWTAGEWVEARIPEGQFIVDEVLVANGFQRTNELGDDWFDANTRVRSGTLALNGTSELVVEFGEDTRGYTCIEVGGKPADTIRLTINSVWPGDLDHYVSISEFVVIGRPRADP